MFDTNNLKETVTQALTALYDDYKPQVKESIETYLEKLDERLSAVTAASLTGQVDAEFFANRMKDELVLLQNELISLKVLGANVIESAIQKAIEETLKIITGQ